MIPFDLIALSILFLMLNSLIALSAVFLALASFIAGRLAARFSTAESLLETGTNPHLQRTVRVRGQLSPAIFVLAVASCLAHWTFSGVVHLGPQTSAWVILVSLTCGLACVYSFSLLVYAWATALQNLR